MANPKGHVDNLRPMPRVNTEPLGNPIAVRLPQSLDAQVRSLPDRQQFIRDAIAAALEKVQQNH